MLSIYIKLFSPSVFSVTQWSFNILLILFIVNVITGFVIFLNCNICGGNLLNALFSGISFENNKNLNSGYVITIENITDLIKIQRSAAWSDIARRIAHEIKNPLTPIQLSADRLKHKYLSSIKKDKVSLLMSLWKSESILLVGKNPPDEISVKAKLKASKVLRLISFNIININNVKTV